MNKRRGGNNTETKVKGLTVLALMVMVLCAYALVAPAVAQPTPSTPFMIYGWVNYTNGAPVNNPTVSINNTNMSEVFTAETNESYNYYQVLTSSNNVGTGDILHFNASNGNVNEFNHNVTDAEINSTGGFVQNITISGIANHVVISEVQVGGQTAANDEFVELYNPTNSSVSLNGWYLTGKSSDGKEYPLLAGFSDESIPAYGFFLITPQEGYTGSATADATYNQISNFVAADNTVILYSDNKITVVDKVGFGNAVDNETSSYPTNPEGGQSLQRKVNDTISEDGYGPAWDTNNNSADFFIRTNPNPQNSETGPVPPIPELPTLILFSSGLIILACYVLLKRRG